MRASAATVPCPACRGPNRRELLDPADCLTCGGGGRVELGPQPAERSLQELLERIRGQFPPATLPLPPAGAPAPPRPWSDAGAGEEG